MASVDGITPGEALVRLEGVCGNYTWMMDYDDKYKVARTFREAKR